MKDQRLRRSVLWHLPPSGSIWFVGAVGLILVRSFNMEEGHAGSGPLAPHLRALASAKNLEAGPILHFKTDEEYHDPRVRWLEYSRVAYFPSSIVLIPNDGTARLIASKIRAENRSAPRWSRFGKSKRFFLRYRVEGATVEVIFSTGAGSFTVHNGKDKQHGFYADDKLTEELFLMLGF